MKNLVFFDADEHLTLLPLTFTKPVSELRIGILTVAEKWNAIFKLSYSHYTQPHLNELYPLTLSDDNLFISGALLPNNELIKALEALPSGVNLISKGKTIAAKGNTLNVITNPSHTIEFSGEVELVLRPWNVFGYAGAQVEADIELLNLQSSSHAISHTSVIGDSSKLFIDPSAKVYATSLNTSQGSIYIGPNSEVMEGSVIRGPFALGENSVVKMGAKIYGDTAIGPHCKVGGEIANSVIQGYSNKGHDGYLGNSVLGEWCNLGADTNTSNLKNNYSDVRVWDYITEAAVSTELTFCGLIMGDHSKSSINTMLNTGTLVGVGSNIFGASFPPKFVPSFSWGGGTDFQVHDFEKFCSTASRVMARRKKELSDEYGRMLLSIFSDTKKYRTK